MTSPKNRHRLVGMAPQACALVETAILKLPHHTLPHGNIQAPRDERCILLNERTGQYSLIALPRDAAQSGGLAQGFFWKAL